MHNQAPVDYDCPLCSFIRVKSHEPPGSSMEDVVAETDQVMALISVHQWPNNPGNIIVFPVAHYENIFDLPPRLAFAVHDMSRAVAIAMKAAWNCEGISTRQHNGKAGNQDVWHYHLHVSPRYGGDELYETYTTAAKIMPPEEREVYSAQIRKEMRNWKPATP